MNPLVRLAAIVALGATSIVLVCSGPARGTDVLMPGKITIVKDTKLFKVVAKDPLKVPFPLPAPGSGGDPTFGGSGGDLLVVDTGSTGTLSDSLTGGVWTGLGNPAGTTGYKYKNTLAPTNGAVKIMIIKAKVVKVIAKDDGSLQHGMAAGNVGINISVGSTPDQYCAEFGGSTVKNDPNLWKRKDAPAPLGCVSTTSSSSSTTSTSSSSSSTFGPCCGGFTHGVFTSGAAAGTCGTLIDFNGGTFNTVTCGGLYFGGGANAVPLPAITPDLGQTVVGLTSCTVQTATIAPTTSVDTGSNLNCSSPGCFFGGPLSIPNTASTATSTCVINTVKTAASGTVECGLGQQDVSLPLDSEIFLTGDDKTDPTDTIPGIQPCPLCSSGTCIGGPNDTLPCTPGDTNQSGTLPGYPTSHDCPPDPMFSIGTIPINLALTTGTTSWTGTVATNDTGSTVSTQQRVFCGYCRDRNASNCFKGDPDTACPVSSPPFQQCWSAGATFGSACTEPFESCEQRDGGAYGPGGGSVKTITLAGTTAGNVFDGAPHAQKLVTNFCIPPTFNATVDATADLPGPGALALTGLTELCSSASPCPGP